MGLVGTGRRATRAGCVIVAGDTPVGTVTVGALSPTLGYPIALGCVVHDVSEPGTALGVDIRANAAEFTVTPPAVLQALVARTPARKGPST